MLFTCVICAELIKPSDDAHVTACGHIFHYICLCKWIERSKTCPQCRNKCTLSSLRRIYFNIANIDGNEGNIGLLQEQLESASLKNKVLNKELEETKKQIQEFKITQKKSVKTISKLAEEVEKNKLLMSSYNDMIKALRSENKVVEDYRKENNELKQKLNLMSSIQVILQDIGSSVDKLLKDENNPKTLAVWITTLRRELKQSENKKTDLRKSLQSLQNDLRKVQDEKSALEEKIVSLESENYRLLEKVKELEIPKESDSFSETKSITTPKDTDCVVLVDKLNKITPRTFEKIRKIEESNSPYFNIKSSGIGLGILEKFKYKNVTENNPATLKRSTTDLSEKYSILKKPRLDDLPTKKSSSLVFNGLGTSEPLSLRPFEKKKSSLNERVKSGKLKKLSS